MSFSSEIWCNDNPAAILKPSDSYFLNGFKPTTLGNNFWLNYLFNYATTHSQLPVGSLSSSFSDVMGGSLLCNGDTIGSSASGATYTGDDYKTLYSTIWSIAPVTGGRGATAEDDYNANKTIALPDMREKALMGDTGINQGAFPRYSNHGSATVTLTVDEMPVMKPTVNDPTHHHDFATGYTVTPTGGLVPRIWDVDTPGTSNTHLATTGITLDPVGNTTNPGGVADPHNNIQNTIVGNWFIKF